MKALRIVLAVLAGAIVLLAIVAVIIVRSFDLNDYKDEITAFVEARTGRTLTIDDNIEFSLFPWFAVETGGVSLSDDPAFGDRSFVTVDSLSARVRVWPLLRRRIEIGRVILDGINVNLGMDMEGRGNWTSLDTTPAAEAPAAEAPEPGRPAINALAVEGIELRNARILWHDVNGEVAYVVRDLSLVTGPVNDNDPVEVTLALSLLDVASQDSAAVELRGLATIRPALELGELRGSVRLLDSRDEERALTTLELDSLSFADGILRSGPAELAATLRRPPVGRDGLGIEVRLASMTLDSGTEDLVVNEFAVTAGQTRASVDLTGQAMLSDPRLTGTVDLRGTTLAGLFETLGMDPSALLGPAGPATTDAGGFSAAAGFAMALTPLTLTVERYEANLLGVDATGRAAIAAEQGLTATIEIASFQPTAPLIAVATAHLPDGVDVGAVTTASLRASMTRAPASAGLDIDGFSLGLDNARIGGRISIEDLADPGRIEGTLEASGLDNRLLGALFGTWLPRELVDASLGTFRLATDFGYEPATRTAAFAPLELTAYGLSADGQLTIVDSGATLALSGRATIAEFSPRDLLARFDLPVPQTSDPSVFRSAVLATSFETRGSNGEFRDIAVELDDSRITGQFSVENFSDPEYRFLLRADRIDADRYLPPRAEPEPAAAAAAAGAGEKHLGDIRIASEALTATNLRGSATVAHLRIGGMDFDQLSTDVAFGQGQAALSSVRTELYGGTFAGGLAIDATGLAGVVHLNGDLRSVALKPMLTAMLGGATLSGTGDVGLDLTGTGDTINEALATAAGSLSLALSNGEIDGVNLGRRLCEAVNAQRGLAPPAQAPKATAYSVIRGTATVAEGVASSTDLYATTGYLDLTGRGGIRLVDQWLDTQFRAALTGAIPIAGCEDLNATIANDPIPLNFTLKGQLPDVDVGFDISQLLSDWARREVRNRVREEVQDSILNRIFN